jgi:uncharacterized protein (DUF1786 family)
MQWKTEFTSAEKSRHVSLAVQDHARQGQMVNQQCYLEVLARLLESVQTKRHEF